MSSKMAVIGDRAALEIRWQWEHEVAPKVDKDPRAFAIVKAVFQQVSEGQLDGAVLSAKVQSSKRDLAEETRQWFEDWYHSLNLTPTVFKPAVSNREFARRQKLNQFLVYRPDSHGVTYEGFMVAVGQANHWTVNQEAGRQKIQWEPAAQGYWFWADASPDCPRLGTPWNKLMADFTGKTRLPCLEEYVLLWHAYKARTKQMLDTRTWCWLRTRYKYAYGQLSALGAYGYVGRVRICIWGPEDLEVPFDGEGGRAAEVVKSAA